VRLWMHLALLCTSCLLRAATACPLDRSAVQNVDSSQQNPDFTIVASDVVVEQGASGSISVSVVRSGGLSGAIEIRLGTQTGLAAPDIEIPNESTTGTLTVFAANTVSVGTYNATIFATSGALSHEASATITIAPAKPTTTPSATVDAERSLAVLTEVHAVLDQLVASKGGSLDYADIRKTLESRTDIKCAGSDPVTGSLTYILDGGGKLFVEIYPSPQDDTPSVTDNLRATIRLVIAPSNRDNYMPSGDTDVAGAVKTSFRLPDSKKYRLLTGIPSALMPDVTYKLMDWFNKAGYTGGSPEPATLDNLRKPERDVGVLYFSTHASHPPTTDQYCLGTATAWSSPQNTDSATLEDYRKGLVDAFWVEHKEDAQGNELRPPVVASNWCIYPEFVTKYMNGVPNGASGTLSRNSLVFLDACWSTSKDADSMRKSFSAPGSVYLGWPGETNPWKASTIARYLFDRLLGVNDEAKSPPQRPFDVGPVLKKAAQRTEAAGNPLTMTDNSQPGLALLPSIKRAIIAPPDQLIIDGVFGEDYGESRRSVSVGGQLIKQCKWNADELQCTVTPDLAGDIVVKVDERKSNPVPLTDWRVHVDYRYMEEGALVEENSLDGHFRADLLEFRNVPDEAPAHRVIDIRPETDSTGSWFSSGTWNYGDGTETWSGSGTYQMCATGAGQCNPGNPAVWLGQVDTAARVLRFVLGGVSVGGGGAQKTVTIVNNEGTSSSKDGLGFAVFDDTDPRCGGMPEFPVLCSTTSDGNSTVSTYHEPIGLGPLTDQVPICSATQAVSLPCLFVALDENYGITSDTVEQQLSDIQTITVKWDAAPAKGSVPTPDTPR
jgi:hypothetical protein